MSTLSLFQIKHTQPPCDVSSFYSHPTHFRAINYKIIINQLIRDKNIVFGTSEEKSSYYPLLLPKDKVHIETKAHVMMNDVDDQLRNRIWSLVVLFLHLLTVFLQSPTKTNSTDLWPHWNTKNTCKENKMEQIRIHFFIEYRHMYLTPPIKLKLYITSSPISLN